MQWTGGINAFCIGLWTWWTFTTRENEKDKKLWLSFGSQESQGGRSLTWFSWEDWFLPARIFRAEQPGIDSHSLGGEHAASIVPWFVEEKQGKI